MPLPGYSCLYLSGLIFKFYKMKTLSLLLIAAMSFLYVNLFAQNKAGKKDTASYTVFYSCPMHPEEMKKQPGNCAKCGMQLQPSKKEVMKKEVMKNYSCPMHPQVTSAKPGKCSACGMDLVLSSKEKNKLEVINNFTCPMHPDVTSDSAGTCPKCGMKLVKSGKQ